MYLDKDFLVEKLDLKKSVMRGVNLMSTCPFPDHRDTHPSFGINLDTSAWNCYSCDEKGKSIDSLFFKLGIEIPDKIKLWSRKGKLKNVQQTAPQELKPWWLDIISDGAGEAYKLLKKRAVTKKTIEYFKIGCRGRILRFPFWDDKQLLTGWAERNSKWSFRWKMRPQGVIKLNQLYGIDKIDKKQGLFVVEGMVDAIKIWQWGYQAVATFGAFISDRQAELIVKHSSKVFLLPDNDAAGMKFFHYLIQKLQGKVKLYVTKYPKGFKDIGEGKVDKKFFVGLLKKKKLWLKRAPELIKSS